MSAMGHSFDGSRAEYTLIPKDHVFHLSILPAEDIAAAGETYFTAWGSLKEELETAAGDQLLLRGASCAFGFTALKPEKACVQK